MLGELLGNANQLLDLSDETGTKVGYYRASSLTKLQEAYGSAKAVYDAQTVAAYSAMYDVLYQEYANLLNNDYARVNITEGYAYRLTNKAYPGRSMAVNTENNQMSGIETAESNAQLWYFEAGASPGTYYLKNKATGLYPGDVSTGAVLNADKSDKTTDNGAHAYNLQNMGNGLFALVGKTGLHCSSSQSYNIVGWRTDADATQWYITAEVVDETIEERLKLEETIAKTEALVNEMAEVKIKGSALDLTTCTITSNTPETGHETKYLVDGNPETFFHTNWSGAAISENHNFIIDLGEGNSLEQFAFNYITLPNSANNVDAPEAMVIEGSTNGTDYTSITSLSGLPTTKGTTYASATLGTKGTAYRYLRFSVTDATGGKLGSYYYFGLAEFGLTNMQTELLSVKDGYSSSETAILNACDGLYAANLVYNNETATQAELQAAASTLNAYYETLLEAYNENAGLEAKKKELQTLINKTTVLIGECGSVVYAEETTPQLNTLAAPYKLSDNNGASQGSLDKLYDGKQGEANSYTSSWGGTPTQASYLQVDLGTGKELEELIFTFTNRNEGNAPTPTEIVVSASADGNTFTNLATYTSEEANWPPAANNQNIAATKWTSPVIKATSACRYWRFTVTKSQRNSGGETNANGIYHFGISEFGIVIPASCKVTVNEGMGGVTEELLLATYDENQEAKSTLTYATTEAQLDKAIANLQAQYDALEAAKNVVDKSGLIQLIETATTRLGECGTVTPNGDVLDVTLNEQAGSVNKNMLRDLYSAIENAQGVIDNTKATQEDVNAEIAELTAQIGVVETAQINPAKANLQQEINEMEKLLAACATAPGSASQQLIADCQAALQTAKEVYNADGTTVKGYADAEATLNTKRVALSEAKESPAKADLKTAIEAMENLLAECEDYSDSEIQQLIEGGETALQTAKNVYDADNTTVERYSQATTNLTELYTDLSVAKAKADLRAKITQLAELIAACRIEETGSVRQESACDVSDAESGKNGNEYYLLVDAGEGETLKNFYFSYQTQTDESLFPYKIEVYGSENNSEFTDLLATFTTNGENALPSTAGASWTSGDINSVSAYRYLRFNVTVVGKSLPVDGDKDLDTSNGGAQLSNKYKKTLTSESTENISGDFSSVMSNFRLTKIVDVEKTYVYYKGDVTENQLNEATEANADATTIANGSWDSAELTSTKDNIQVIYDEILKASRYITVNLTSTSKEIDTLLKGIDDSQTIGTFSAPWATIVPEGVTAYYAKQKYDGGTVSLTPVESNILPANQGVILIGDVGVNSVKFELAEEGVEGADLSENTFYNSAKGPVVMEGNGYILAKGGQGIGFYHATPGSTLKQGKAFFRLPAGASALSLVLKFGDNTTDIDFIGTDMDNVDEPIFDVYGRQVTQILKGRVYIKNGKKFIAK